MAIITKKATHNFDFATQSMSATRLAKAQKAAIKLLDKQFAVKAEFLSGVFDDEVKLTGNPENVKAARAYVSSL